MENETETLSVYEFPAQRASPATGSEGYRFGGEVICNNKQVQGKFLETAASQEVREDGARLLRPRHGSTALEAAEILRARRVKMQHALEGLIDSFTEG